MAAMLNKRRRLWKAQKGRCCYCLRPMNRRVSPLHQDYPTVEHLHRKADGGTSRIGNLALAHRQCNERRGDLDWLTYTSLVRGEITL